MKLPSKENCNHGKYYRDVYLASETLGCESFYLKALAQKMGQNFAETNTSINEIRATAMGIDVKELRRRRLINKMQEKVEMMKQLAQDRNYQCIETSDNDQLQ